MDRKHQMVMNDMLAVEPFKDEDRKIQVEGGVIKPINQAQLTPLKVLFTSFKYEEYDYQAGDVVLVRSKLHHDSIYNRSIYEWDGVRFILIPVKEVVMRIWEDGKVQASVKESFLAQDTE